MIPKLLRVAPKFRKHKNFLMDEGRSSFCGLLHATSLMLCLRGVASRPMPILTHHPSKAPLSRAEKAKLAVARRQQSAAVTAIRTKLHGYRWGIGAAVSAGESPKQIFVHIFDGLIADVQKLVERPQGMIVEFLDRRENPESTMSSYSPVSSKSQAESSVVPMTESPLNAPTSSTISTSVPASQ